MSLFTPAQTLENYCATGCAKAERAPLPAFLLAVLAGALIALGGAASATATYAVANPSLAKLISGLLFPFGLAIVILSGAELFTGNCLITLSVLDRKTSLGSMLRSWAIVYLGTFVGAAAVAGSYVYFGRLPADLAAAMARTASAKCSLTFPQGVVLGLWCNILVCLAVLLSLSAQDLSGRVMGAYLPVAFFIFCGFEHSVANMYYIPAGLFVGTLPQYASALEGLSLPALNWGNFFFANLLPVTLGNILGGALLSYLLFRSHLGAPAPQQSRT